jgi:opacity protein-like surface antigen
MKKVTILLLLFLASINFAEAQLTKAGGGLAYGTGVWFRNETEDISHKTGNPAINFRAIYEVSLPFHIVPSVSIFMPRVNKEDFGEYSYKQSLSAFLFDIDAHYVFNSLDRFEFYGLGGLNITLLSMKYKQSDPDGNFTDGSSESAIGLNLGAGSYMKLTEQLDAFAEIKYILSKRDQLMITAGVLLNLDWLKKNETKAF